MVEKAWVASREKILEPAILVAQDTLKQVLDRVTLSKFVGEPWKIAYAAICAAFLILVLIVFVWARDEIVDELQHSERAKIVAYIDKPSFDEATDLFYDVIVDGKRWRNRYMHGSIDGSHPEDFAFYQIGECYFVYATRNPAEIEAIVDLENGFMFSMHSLEDVESCHRQRLVQSRMRELTDALSSPMRLSGFILSEECAAQEAK